MAINKFPLVRWLNHKGLLLQRGCDPMQPLDLALRIVLLGLCVIMLLVSVQAFKRAKGKRMMWVLISFLGLTTLAILALWGEIGGDAVWDIPNAIVLLLLLIIGTNYLALLRG
jgi:hypothetical protein